MLKFFSALHLILILLKSEILFFKFLLSKMTKFQQQKKSWKITLIEFFFYKTYNCSKKAKEIEG